MDLKPLNCQIVLFNPLEILPLISYNLLYHTSASLLESNMEVLNQITGEIFVSVDNACHALDEMTLPEGYVTTIKRQ